MIIRTSVLIVIIFLSVHHQSSAAYLDEEIYKELNIDSVVEAVPDDVNEIIGSYDILSGQGLLSALENLQEKMIAAIREQVLSAAEPVIKTFKIIVICSLVSLMMPDKNFEFPTILVGCTAISYLNLSEAHSFFSDSIEMIQKIYDFSTALLPCLAGASVFTGATMSAGIKYTAAAVFMNLLLNFSNTVLVPFIKMYLVCMLGDCIFKQPILGTVSNVIHKASIMFLTGSVMLFTTYLSVAGLVTGTGELFASRIARTTLSNGLPIVGKIISDTASTMVAGASLLRNGIGVFGMLVLIGILIIPIVSIGLRYMLFKLLSNVNDFWSEQRFTKLMKGLSDGYGMMLAIVGSGFIMMFFTLLSFMQLTGV